MGEWPTETGSDREFTLFAREELEALVRDQTDALQNVMDTMVDVLLKLGPEGRVQLANAAVETKLGYDPDAVTGKPIDRLLADPDRAEGLDTLTDREFVTLLVREGSVSDVEVAFATRGGAVVPMSLSASVMKDDGSVTGIVCVGKDITERKTAEERAEFLHSVLRHDIGNRLQVAAGYLDLLAESDLSDQQQDRVGKVRGAVADATELLEKVRMLDRMDSEATSGPVPLGTHIDTAVERHQDRADDAGVEISRPDDAAVTVQAGPLLTEVVANLVENALNHANGSRIDLSVHERDDAVDVVVEDDGDGIPEGEREQILERGCHGSGSTGSGLGMYIVSEVVDTYRGSVEVGESDAGGARFVVTLRA